MSKLYDSLKYFYQKAASLKRPFIKYPVSKGGFNAITRSKMDEFNRVRYHGPKKLACYNPFVNLYFNSRGQGVVCCRNQDTVLGTYPEYSINEIWFGKVAGELRDHMRNNDFSMGCKYCEHQFRTSRFFGLPSMHADYYSSTKLDYPKIIELELSNTCNLQCVMCSGIVSSSIRKCRENLPPLENNYDSKFVEQLAEYLPHAKEIKFYGGEPFLIDTYYQIWDVLLKIKSKAKLHVVTNGTVLTDRVRNYLRNLNFTITVSFDALNKEQFESIRVGADFDKVKQNIEEYYDLLNGKGLSLSLTPMKNNCKEVPKVIDYCNTMNATINLSFVENPAEMALWTMPSDQLEELEEYYNSYTFKPHSGVNSSYNIKAFAQFVKQISVYKSNNKQREDLYKSKLLTKPEFAVIVEDVLSKSLYENVLFESDKTIILNEMASFEAQLTELQKQMLYTSLGNTLKEKGVESIRDLMFDGLDVSDLNKKLAKYTIMPNIYDKAYSDIS